MRLPSEVPFLERATLLAEWQNELFQKGFWVERLARRLGVCEIAPHSLLFWHPNLQLQVFGSTQGRPPAQLPCLQDPNRAPLADTCDRSLSGRKRRTSVYHVGNTFCLHDDDDRDGASCWYSDGVSHSSMDYPRQLAPKTLFSYSYRALNSAYSQWAARWFRWFDDAGEPIFPKRQNYGGLLTKHAERKLATRDEVTRGHRRESGEWLVAIHALTPQVCNRGRDLAERRQKWN